MTETQLVKAVILALGSRFDCRVWRQNTGALRDATGRLIRFGIPGAADITGILANGRRLEIEVKTDTGRLSKQQARYGQMIHRMGGLYFVVRSVEDAVDRVDAALLGEAGTR